jgi:hypothetical protein
MSSFNCRFSGWGEKRGRSHYRWASLRQVTVTWVLLDRHEKVVLVFDIVAYAQKLFWLLCYPLPTVTSVIMLLSLQYCNNTKFARF